MNKKQNKDTKKINLEIDELKRNLLNYRFQKSSGQLEKTGEIKKTRRKIASLMFNLNKISKEKNA
tara:strand:+ start:619 stop:813 length:195 start_codon:yes stop_codon:yes gene_type:complete